MRPFLLILALATATADGSSILDQFTALRIGSFTSQAQSDRDARYDVATWHVAEIWSGRSAMERWFYAESWLEEASAPYMQRITRVQDRGDGSLTETRYRANALDQHVGAWKQPSKFPEREDLKLEALSGCDTVWTRAGHDRFEGSTLGNRCANRYKDASYAISRAMLSADVSTNWDRGFSSDGQLVWGPAHGGYQFRRIGDDACVAPVRMLVYGEIEDRSKFGAYGRALGQSGLYPKNGGYYEAITPPLAVFEGEPGDQRGVVIARFPCLEAAKAFWYSDEYKAIRPLREGIATFEVLVLPEPRVPEYLDWR